MSNYKWRKIMSEQVTKDDLRQFSLMIIDEVRKLKPEIKKDDNLEWLKSRAARKLLTMSRIVAKPKSNRKD